MMLRMSKSLHLHHHRISKQVSTFSTAKLSMVNFLLFLVVCELISTGIAFFPVTGPMKPFQKTCQRPHRNFDAFHQLKQEICHTISNCATTRKQEQRDFALNQKHCLALSSSSSSSDHVRNVPTFIHKLNGSTKWLVTIANTIGVWSHPHQFNGPFIVVGSILSVYLTDLLKKIINQGRPKGSPFTDPGMPSSHSLVSFFMAIAWMSVLTLNMKRHLLIGKILLIAFASIVSVLRVICGYHSWAQIFVGAILGSVLGQGWIIFGDSLFVRNHPKVLLVMSWSTYLLGSTFFIYKNMRSWVGQNKHL